MTPDPPGPSAPPAPTPPDGTATSSPAGAAARMAWLRDELGRQLTVYRRRRTRDKRKAFGLQMSTVVLSATITVVLGVRATGTAEERLADIALALGAVITVLAAADAFFAHRGLWILRTQTVRNLEAFARRVDYHQAGLDGRPPDPATVDRLVAELDGILAADHTAWQQLRAANSAVAPVADAAPPSAPAPTGGQVGS